MRKAKLKVRFFQKQQSIEIQSSKLASAAALPNLKHIQNGKEHLKFTQP